MDSENRRHFSRILFKTRARLLLDSDAIAVSLLDLSLKGALVQPGATVNPEPGKTCTLELALDEGGAQIRMEMEVAHYRSGCLGLNCREIDLDSMIHLRRLVELNIGDESILQRELSALASPHEDANNIQE